jgi:type I restriction enzyme M protein
MLARLHGQMSEPPPPQFCCPHPIRRASPDTFPAPRRRGARAALRGVFEDAYNYMKSGRLMRQVINKIQEIDFNDLADRQHFGDIYEQILNDLQSAGNAV